MKVPTNSKASILASIKKAFDISASAVEVYRDAPKQTAKYRQENADRLLDTMISVSNMLDNLHHKIDREVKEEFGPLFHCNKETVDATIVNVRGEMLKRFAHFPIAAALIETFMLYFESEFKFMCHFKALHTQAMAEDRMRDNPDCYGVDGEPNDIGNRVGKPKE